jgi:dihydrofolate reductase
VTGRVNPVRNLVYAINISIDGCCDHTKFGGGGDGHEILRHYTKLLEASDVLVYGRKTYQLMVPYWPDVAKDPSSDRAEREFAEALCAAKKVVFSRSLEGPLGENTRIVRTDIREEVLKLKREPGKNILTGGVSIPSELVKLGLVDEFHFVLHPAVVGEGRRLLDGAGIEPGLHLASSERFNSGALALHYLRNPGP